MGGSSYSLDTRAALRSAKMMACATAGYADTFKHDTDVKRGVAPVMHELLDPRKMRNGVRESRDSTEHPNSVGVAVCCDVTGSFADLPKQIVKQVPNLMGAIITNGALDHPHILFSAVGDAECDRVPLQVGQFEAGTEIEDTLDNFYLEGGGGANRHESYDLFFYFLARCTSMDCVEKRGKKGYAFLIQDEPFRSTCPKYDIEKVFGQKVQADIPIETLIAEALEKFELFVIRPRNVTWGKDPHVTQAWKRLLPDRIIEVQDVQNICQVIALQIADCEGVDLDKVAASFDGDSKALTVIKSGLAKTTRTIKATKSGEIKTTPKSSKRL
jgi:hypothetical protein